MTPVVKLTWFLSKRLFPIANFGISGVGRDVQGVCMASMFCGLSDSHIIRIVCLSEKGWNRMIFCSHNCEVWWLLDYWFFFSQIHLSITSGEATTLRESMSCVSQRWKQKLNYPNSAKWPLLGLLFIKEIILFYSLWLLSLGKQGWLPNSDNLSVLL